MTNKELLYIEDALGHEKFFQNSCRETAGKLSDGELKGFVEQLASNHQRIFSEFYSLLS